MASRGTLQRDGQAGQRTSWAGPDVPSGRRPPSAPRERRPALAALAVLLIAGGALGAGFLVQNSGKRVGAIAVSSVIAAGQKIPAGALTEVQVASNTGLDFVKWTEVQQVTQYYAKTTLYPGTLLTTQMATSSSSQTANHAVAELALKEGQYPVQLQVGDTVNVWADGVSPAGCPGANRLAQDATVLDITSPAAGASGLDVELAINQANQQDVACNAAAGNVSVVMVTRSGAGSGAGSSPTPPVTPSPGATTGHHSPTPSSSKSASTKHS